MASSEIKYKWWPLAVFLTAAVAIAVGLYATNQPARNAFGVAGFVAIALYAAFVMFKRPDNLSGVLAAGATVLGPAIANQYVVLRVPQLAESMTAASLIVQITFVFIGIISTFLFVVGKVLASKGEQHTKVDSVIGILVAGSVAVYVSIAPISTTGGQSPVLGMPMPAFDGILICRAALALLGVYLTLRPEAREA